MSFETRSCQLKQTETCKPKTATSIHFTFQVTDLLKKFCLKTKIEYTEYTNFKKAYINKPK